MSSSPESIQSNHENQLDPAQQAQLEAYLAQGMNEEQARMALETGQIPLEYILEQPAYPSQETAEQTPSPETEEAKKEAFELTFTEEVHKALHEAKDKSQEKSASVIAERAMHDKRVEDARKLVGQELAIPVAKEVEEQAIELGLKRENLDNHQEKQIAKAAANGESPVAAVVHAESEANGAEDDESVQLAGIRERNNGATDKIMGRLTRSVTNRLHNLGIKSKESAKAHRQTITNELAGSIDAIDRAGGAKELDISNRTQAERSMNQVVGEELINAVANPRRMTRQTREQLQKQMKDNSAAVRELASAVATAHNGGTVSELTQRRVGQAMAGEDLQHVA
jgi:hypothetical protein